MRFLTESTEKHPNIEDPLFPRDKYLNFVSVSFMKHAQKLISPLSHHGYFAHPSAMYEYIRPWLLRQACMHTCTHAFMHECVRSLALYTEKDRLAALPPHSAVAQ